VSPGYRVHLEDRCRRCGFAPEYPSQLEIHHQDLDRSNNKPPNLVTLCANCHVLLHRTRRKLDGRGPRGSRRPRKILKFDMLAAERHAATFKVISDATRLAVVACLARVGEVCVTDLTESFELSQPSMSHHLRLLREAGLLDVDYRGTMSLYRVSPDALERLQSALVDACLEI
jgi:DNA-binding transcriptional ArsR family regulator